MIIYKRDNKESKTTFLQISLTQTKGNIKWPEVYRSPEEEIEYIFTLTHAHLLIDRLSKDKIKITQVRDIKEIREIIIN